MMLLVPVQENFSRNCKINYDNNDIITCTQCTHINVELTARYSDIVKKGKQNTYKTIKRRMKRKQHQTTTEQMYFIKNDDNFFVESFESFLLCAGGAVKG